MKDILKPEHGRLLNFDLRFCIKLEDSVMEPVKLNGLLETSSRRLPWWPMLDSVLPL